jgi:ADP-heptose:LPS heptosyltransferase
MAKNEIARRGLYSTAPPPAEAQVIHCAYPWRDARAGSVLGAMSKQCGVGLGDFRLPVKPDWQEVADELIEALEPDRPLLITRPLLTVFERSNWGTSKAKQARNPDPAAYGELFAGIRERYFVISIADAIPAREKVVLPIAADREYHHGELELETLIALTARASLVYCSPCFLTVLAQAVQTPMVCVFGGFEGANSFSPGARYSPWLPIEPDNACVCWDWNCRHDKTIDTVAAALRIDRFIRDYDADTAYPEHARQPAATAQAHAAA